MTQENMSTNLETPKKAFENPIGTFDHVIANLKKYDATSLVNLVVYGMYSKDSKRVASYMTRLKLPETHYKQLRFFAAAFDDTIQDIPKFVAQQKAQLLTIAKQKEAKVSQQAFDKCLSLIKSKFFLKWYAFLWMHEKNIDATLLSPDFVIAYILGIQVDQLKIGLAKLKANEIESFYDEIMSIAFKANITGLFEKQKMEAEFLSLPANRSKFFKLYQNIQREFHNSPPEFVDIHCVRQALGLVSQDDKINLDEYLKNLENYKDNKQKALIPKEKVASAPKDKSVSEQWKDFVKNFKPNDQEQTSLQDHFTLNPPLEMTIVKKIEQQIGYQLTKDYVEFLSIHNGQKLNCFNRLMPLSTLFSLEEAVKKWLDFSKDPDLQKFDDKVPPYWQPHFFPIAGSDGDYDCINLKTGEINILYRVDGVDPTAEYESFSHFLADAINNHME